MSVSVDVVKDANVRGAAGVSVIWKLQDVSQVRATCLNKARFHLTMRTTTKAHDRPEKWL